MLGPRSRRVGACLAGALAIGLLPGRASAAPEALQEHRAFCANVPSSIPRFVDVPRRDDYIECLDFAGITKGTADRRFEPGAVVTRAQMASFLARVADLAHELEVGDVAELPADDGTSAFTDAIPEVHADNVRRLERAGIVRGGPGGAPRSTFGADLPVDRAQMATFLNRTADFLADGAVDGAGDHESDEHHFTDNVVEPHVANVDGLAAKGILVGTTGLRGPYLPLAQVTREQMASFLVRTMAQLLDDGVVGRLPPDERATLTRTGSGPVAPGGIVYATLDREAEDVWETTVGGACTYDDPFGPDGDADRTTPGFQYVVHIPHTAALGECVLHFNVQLDEDSVTYDLRVTVARGVDGLPFGPDGPLEVAQGDDVTFTTDLDHGIVPDYRVTLVDTEDVTVGPDGRVAFRPDPSAPGRARVGTGRAVITAVNGVAAPPGTTRTVRVEPQQAGRMSVTVEGTGPGSVTAVLFHNGGADTPRLELDDAGHPTETFGLAGPLRVVAP